MADGSDPEDFSGGEKDRLATRIDTMPETKVYDLQDQLNDVLRSPLEPATMTKDRASKLYARTWKRLKNIWGDKK